MQGGRAGCVAGRRGPGTSTACSRPGVERHSIQLTRHCSRMAVSVTEVRRTFRIVNRLGLHARPASALVKLAAGFKAEIYVEKEGQRARSTSVIELLLLCGQPDSEVTVVAIGDDAEQAVMAIG